MAYPGTAFSIDKQWIVVEPWPGGNIHLAWTQLNRIARGWSWDGVVWSDLALGDPATLEENPDCDHQGDPSSDPCVAIGAQPVISADGAYYLAWTTYKPTPDIMVERSSDGGKSFDGRIVVRHAKSIAPPPAYRIETLPSMAVDLTNGTRRGHLYLAWHDQDPTTNATDIHVSSSSDGAVNWSDPVRVTDDPPASSRLQFHPAVAVGPDGGVHVAWYDQRNGPDREGGPHLLDVYYSRSDDGGKTWSPNLRVTTDSFDPARSRNQNGTKFLGEYLGLSVGGDGIAHIAWADTRDDRPGDNDADLYAARIHR